MVAPRPQGPLDLSEHRMVLRFGEIHVVEEIGIDHVDRLGLELLQEVEGILALDLQGTETRQLLRGDVSRTVDPTYPVSLRFEVT